MLRRNGRLARNVIFSSCGIARRVDYAAVIIFTCAITTDTIFAPLSSMDSVQFSFQMGYLLVFVAAHASYRHADKGYTPFIGFMHMPLMAISGSKILCVSLILLRKLRTTFLHKRFRAYILRSNVRRAGCAPGQRQHTGTQHYFFHIGPYRIVIIISYIRTLWYSCVKFRYLPCLNFYNVDHGE
ncbi:hypothetical protein MSKU15_0661 [Komagataeibacter diospyri]|nr:hypothetical protein MSKU15_0661 [Komagataeibacter diospyri]